MLEKTMDNDFLEALLESKGAQLAFSNGWGYGAPIIPAEVTVNDLYNLIPMNPPFSTVGLTGEFHRGKGTNMLRMKDQEGAKGEERCR